MKIGVISDTHIPSKAEKIPDKIMEIFSGVDLILHAGDMVDISAIEELKTIAKVEAVRGNMDGADNHFPTKKVLSVEEVKIGLIHGYGAPFGLRKRIRKEFDELNIIVYGHSHTAYNEIENGILFFNPGSPTDKRFALNHSVGILKINGRDIKGDIINI